jgi:hypothetical protein
LRLAHSPVAKREKKTTSGGTPPAIALSSRCASLLPSRSALELMITLYCGLARSYALVHEFERVHVLAEERDAPRDDLLAPVGRATRCLEVRPPAEEDERRRREDQNDPQRRLRTSQPSLKGWANGHRGGIHGRRIEQRGRHRPIIFSTFRSSYNTYYPPVRGAQGRHPVVCIADKCFCS